MDNQQILLMSLQSKVAKAELTSVPSISVNESLRQFLSVWQCVHGLFLSLLFRNTPVTLLHSAESHGTSSHFGDVNNVWSLNRLVAR